MKNLDKVKAVKILSMAATVIGALGTLGSSWVSDKERDAKLAKLVDERLQK